MNANVLDNSYPWHWDIETAEVSLRQKVHGQLQTRRNMKKCVLTLVGILFLVLPGAFWGEDFRQWLEGFYPRVANQGISRATWETAFDGIEQPDVRVLEKARFQPEFTVGREHLIGSWAGAMGPNSFPPVTWPMR